MAERRTQKSASVAHRSRTRSNAGSRSTSGPVIAIASSSTNAHVFDWRISRSSTLMSARRRSGWKASRSRTTIIRRSNRGVFQSTRTSLRSPCRLSSPCSSLTARTVRRITGSPTPKNSRSLFRYAFSAGARAGLRCRRNSKSIAAAIAAARAGRASVELREDLFCENVNPLELVAADVVQIDAIEAEVDELLDLATVRVRVRGDQHAALEVLGPDQLGHLREVIR